MAIEEASARPLSEKDTAKRRKELKANIDKWTADAAQYTSLDEKPLLEMLQAKIAAAKAELGDLLSIGQRLDRAQEYALRCRKRAVKAKEALVRKQQKR